MSRPRRTHANALPLTNARRVLYIQLVSIRRTALHIGDECLVMRARRLARRLTRIYDEELRVLGIASAQLNLLVTIGAAGPLRASDIGDHLDIEKSTLSRTLARLQAQGFIESEKDQHLRLTAAGERVLGAARPAWQRAQARAARELGNRLAQALSEIPA
jgi:DNA-binding MarR family transcriptional regulator